MGSYFDFGGAAPVRIPSSYRCEICIIAQTTLQILDPRTGDLVLIPRERWSEIPALIKYAERYRGEPLRLRVADLDFLVQLANEPARPALPGEIQ